MSTPPSRLRGRMTKVTYLFEDPDDPARVTGHLQSPDWTEDDRAALLGLTRYEATLCPGGCQQPRELAWHRRTDGEWEAPGWVCHACTAQKGEEVSFALPELHMPAAQRELLDAEPFDLLKTTTPPEKRSDHSDGG